MKKQFPTDVKNFLSRKLPWYCNPCSLWSHMTNYPPQACLRSPVSDHVTFAPCVASTPWFDAYKDTYLDFLKQSDHETIKHYVSGMYIQGGGATRIPPPTASPMLYRGEGPPTLLPMCMGRGCLRHTQSCTYFKSSYTCIHMYTHMYLRSS